MPKASDLATIKEYSNDSKTEDKKGGWARDRKGGGGSEKGPPPSLNV